MVVRDRGGYTIATRFAAAEGEEAAAPPAARAPPRPPTLAEAASAPSDERPLLLPLLGWHRVARAAALLPADWRLPAAAAAHLVEICDAQCELLDALDGTAPPPTAAAMGPDAEGIEVDRTAELAEGLGGRFEAVVAALG